jgi:hypothetical protein
LIVVFHSNNRIIEIVSVENQAIDFDKNDTIAAGIYKLAILFPTKKIVWCHLEAKRNLNLETINSDFV